MAGVQSGGDRQELHERIRVHSLAAAKRVKEDGGANDLFERLRADSAFARANLSDALEPRRFVGRAPEQVDAFVRDVVGPIRARLAGAGSSAEELRV